MRWYLTVLRKYAVFEGRARRKEYWYFTLFNFLIMVVLQILKVIATESGDNAGATLFEVLYILYILGVIVPSLTLSVRRLHDTGHSGWWCFIAFLPIIGSIVLLVWFVSDSNPQANPYGPNPKTGSGGPAFAIPIKPE